VILSFVCHKRKTLTDCILLFSLHLVKLFLGGCFFVVRV